MSRELQRSFATVLPGEDWLTDPSRFSDFESTSCWEACMVQAGMEYLRDDGTSVNHLNRSLEGIHQLAQLTLGTLSDVSQDETDAATFSRDPWARADHCLEAEGHFSNIVGSVSASKDRIRTVVYYDASKAPIFVQKGSGEPTAMNVVPVSIVDIMDGHEVVHTYPPGWLFGLSTIDLQPANEQRPLVNGSSRQRKKLAVLATSENAGLCDAQGNAVQSTSTIKGVRPLRISVFGIPDPDVRCQNAAYFSLNEQRLAETTAETTFLGFAEEVIHDVLARRHDGEALFV